MVASEWLFRVESVKSCLAVAIEWALSSIDEETTRSRLWEVVYQRNGVSRHSAYALEIHELLLNDASIDDKIMNLVTSDVGCLLLTDPPVPPPSDYELYKERFCGKEAVQELMEECPGEFETILELLFRDTNRIAFIGWDGDFITYFDRD